MLALRSQAQVETFLAQVCEGTPPRSAAKAAGLSWTGIERLMVAAEAGQELSPVHEDFYIRLRSALTRAVSERIDNIKAHEFKDWKASAFLLKLIDPETFGDKKDAQPAVNVNIGSSYDGDTTGRVLSECWPRIARIIAEETVDLPDGDERASRIASRVVAEFGPSRATIETKAVAE